MPGEVFRDYWQLRVGAAAAKLEAARRIIDHGTTRGTIAEHAVRSIVGPVLPSRYGIAGGFLISKTADLSQQIDLLVFDRFESSPVYEDEVVAVVSPEMGAMAVEVKSTLNKKELGEAVTNLASVRRLNGNITTVLFTFAGMSAKTMGKHLPTFLTPVPAAERVDVLISLQNDYVAELDRTATRSTYSFYEVAGVAVKTLLLNAVASAKVDNLRDYVDVGPVIGSPTSVINV